MIKLLSATVSISILAMLSACKSDSGSSGLHDTFAKINKEVLQNSKAYPTLEEATSTIGHRLTGSSNGHKAEEYVYNKFKEYGFDSVRFDEFEVKAWSRGTISVSIDGTAVSSVSLGQSPLSANVDGELVYLGNGLKEDYDSVGNVVKGKIVLVYLGVLDQSKKGTQNLHRSVKTSLAIDHGAKGVIMFNSVDKGVLLTGTASVNGDLISVPAVCIGKEAGFSLIKKMKGKKTLAHISMTNSSDMIKARNVIATLRGSEMPNERIILGGHLDSWDLATGAIDNGIGSFAVLDIARAFKANKLAPKRTLQFVLFMGEEQGLLGSKHLVAKEVKDSSIQNIKYMMNLDMSGNPIGIHAGNKSDDSTFFQNLGAVIKSIDTVFTNSFSKGPGLHSDHQPFMLEGVPILGVISNLDKSIYRCYHSDCDNFTLVNEVHLRNTARFGTMILYGLANADQLPAHRLDSEATREFMIESHLKEPLIMAGDWKWDK